MKKITKVAIFIFLAIQITGCGNAYKKFYTSVIDTKTSTDLVLLEEDQDPIIYYSKDLSADIYTLKAKNWVVVGYSSFIGQLNRKNNPGRWAKVLGATMVLTTSKYKNTKTYSGVNAVNNTQVTQHQGNVSGNTTYTNRYNHYVGSSNSSGNYSGTTTTQTTNYIPYSYQVDNYDQGAVFFVKSKKDQGYGLWLQDLTSETRQMIDQNTGVFVEVVFEETEAFYDNFIRNDIISKFNGQTVKNIAHLTELVDNWDGKNGKAIVIRNLKTITLNVNYSKKK